jgi:hypothetical protein
MRLVRTLALFATSLCSACGDPGAALPPAGSGSPFGPAADCGLEAVPFDPHGGAQLQAVSPDGAACVRLLREPLFVRRGIEWRATLLVVSTAARSAVIDDPARLGYLTSHHNCQDVVVATDGEEPIQLTIDGTAVDPDVCFTDDPAAWRLLLEVGDDSCELVPWSPTAER